MISIAIFNNPGIDGFIAVLCLLFFLNGCKKNDRESSSNPATDETDLLSGETLANRYCASCHVFPDPELLDKETWQKGTLPQMAYRAGIYDDTTRQSLIETGPGGLLVEKNGIFPHTPMVDQDQWEAIKKYYLTHSPDSLITPDKDIQMGIDGLTVEIPEFHIAPPMITFMKYNPELDQVYVADAKADYSTINILNSNLESVSTLALPSPISHIAFRGDTLVATLMGGFMPTDNPSGSIIRIFKKPGKREYKGFTTVLKNLQRPVSAAYEDINGDNLEDIIVCEYGNHTGKLSLFIRQENGQFKRKILSPDPGAISVVVKDLNKDSLPDIVALMAQGNERIDIYYNQGNGNFLVQNIVRFPPSYGSLAISLVDWNGDGFDDIIYVNGDNADYSMILKPYHGIRIFLNDGDNKFHEAYFQHINGAYKAIPHDFDRDGDLDIATISFFPDLVRTPEEGFIFMENNGREDGMQFKLHSFRQAASGRWIDMEVADLDQDGNPELILGSYTGIPVQGDIDGALGMQLVENSPALMLLKFR